MKCLQLHYTLYYLCSSCTWFDGGNVGDKLLASWGPTVSQMFLVLNSKCQGIKKSQLLSVNNNQKGNQCNHTRNQLNTCLLEEDRLRSESQLNKNSTHGLMRWLDRIMSLLRFYSLRDSILLHLDYDVHSNCNSCQSFDNFFIHSFMDIAHRYLISRTFLLHFFFTNTVCKIRTVFDIKVRQLFLEWKMQDLYGSKSPLWSTWGQDWWAWKGMFETFHDLNLVTQLHCHEHSFSEAINALPLSFNAEMHLVLYISSVSHLIRWMLLFPHFQWMCLSV